jgi:hypothetical protein
MLKNLSIKQKRHPSGCLCFSAWNELKPAQNTQKMGGFAAVAGICRCSFSYWHEYSESKAVCQDVHFPISYRTQAAILAIKHGIGN